ncbi:MAG: hypothetical protein QM496_05195 [Verrucomicrobiota bacterium]
MTFILDETYRWSVWAAPKDYEGKLDYDAALTGPDLIDFVNGDLFLYLRGVKTREASLDSIEYKIEEGGSLRIRELHLHQFSSPYSKLFVFKG